MKKNILRTCALTAALVLGLTACGSSGNTQTTAADTKSAAATESGETTASQEEVTVRIGLTGTIYEDIWNPIAKELKDEGINIELVQFSDFSLPNAALDSGEIEMNAFQHHAYFNNEVETKGYDISAIGDTFVIAMNLYSDKITDVSELKDGDTIAIPGDASNGGRALKLLESAGIIDIKEDAGANPAPPSDSD